MGQQHQTVQDVLSGMCSGFLSVFAFYPLDLVRTRLQVQHVIVGKTKTNSILKTAVSIYSQHGIRGFYQGLTTNLVGSSFDWGLYFSTFHRLQRSMAHYIDRK